MRVFGIHIGTTAAERKEREALRRARDAAKKRAVEAQGRFLDELTLAFLNDVKKPSK